MYALFSSLLILVLTVLKIYESVPTYNHDAETKKRNIINPLLATLLVLFILEFLARFITCPEKRKFFLTIINIFDLVGILSIVAGIVKNVLPFVSLFALFHWFSMNFWICRCCRLLWFLRMTNFSLGFDYVIKKRWKEIFTILVSLFIICFAFSTIILCLEYKENDSFSSIPHSLWWAFITVTTVGYGDVYPVTPEGKVMAVLLATSGILFIACSAAAWITWVNEYQQIGRYEKPKLTQSKCC